MYPTSMHVRILQDAVDKHAQANMILLQMTSLAQLFIVQCCQASALLNPQESQSFFLHGQLNML